MCLHIIRVSYYWLTVYFYKLSVGFRLIIIPFHIEIYHHKAIISNYILRQCRQVHQIIIFLWRLKNVKKETSWPISICYSCPIAPIVFTKNSRAPG